MPNPLAFRYGAVASELC